MNSSGRRIAALLAALLAGFVFGPIGAFADISLSANDLQAARLTAVTTFDAFTLCAKSDKDVTIEAMEAARTAADGEVFNARITLNGARCVNSLGQQLTTGIFVSVDAAVVPGRRPDGSIDRKGFLVLHDLAPAGVGAAMQQAAAESRASAAGCLVETTAITTRRPTEKLTCRSTAAVSDQSAAHTIDPPLPSVGPRGRNDPRLPAAGALARSRLRARCGPARPCGIAGYGIRGSRVPRRTRAAGRRSARPARPHPARRRAERRSPDRRSDHRRVIREGQAPDELTSPAEHGGCSIPACTKVRAAARRAR